MFLIVKCVSIATRKTLGTVARPVTLPMAMLLSGTYLYPLTGIVYFTMTPLLWAHLITILLPQIILATIVYTIFHIFLYPPEAVLAVLFNGPSGLITAWIAVLHQADIASSLVSNMFLLPTPLRLIFDSVLSREGHDELVLRAKLKKTPSLTPIARAKKWTKSGIKGTIFPVWLFQMFFKILLNFIPFIGPLIVVLMDGPNYGKKAHSRYFELKRFTDKEARYYVKNRRGQYWAFGMVAGILESLPIVGLFFRFTNTVGAAVWASQLETKLATKSKMIIEKRNRNGYSWNKKQRTR